MEIYSKRDLYRDSLKQKLQQTGNMIIPERIQRIKPSTFESFFHCLKNLSFPTSIIDIPKELLKHCDCLTEISIPLNPQFW